MGGRRPLAGHIPRFLGAHNGWEGRAYRRSYVALERDLGPFSAMQALEAARVAALRVQIEVAMATLVDAQRSRRAGRGRRPNHGQIERLARRAGLADQSYSQALDKLRDLTAPAKARKATPADLVARLRAGDRA